MSQENFLIWITGLQHPILNRIAQIFTFMGNELFYFLIIPFVFISISKHIGFRLLYIFLISMYINAYLKIYFAISRPVGVSGVNSIFLDSADVSNYYPYDSFPSGHAQGSAALWGYIAYAFHKRVLWIVAICLIFCISFSRLYAGVHWPLDVLAGILISIIVLLISVKVTRWISNATSIIQWPLATLFPFVLFILFPYDEGAKYSGFLLGSGIAYLLEIRFVHMKISRQFWRRMVAYLITLMGIFALQLGLKMIFPEAVIFDTIRYAAMGVWGFFLAPLMLVVSKIYTSEKIERNKPEDPPVWV